MLNSQRRLDQLSNGHIVQCHSIQLQRFHETLPPVTLSDSLGRTLSANHGDSVRAEWPKVSQQLFILLFIWVGPCCLAVEGWFVLRRLRDYFERFLQQSELLCAENSSRAVGGIQLEEDVRSMFTNRADGDVELFANLTIGMTSGDEL